MSRQSTFTANNVITPGLTPTGDKNGVITVPDFPASGTPVTINTPGPTPPENNVITIPDSPVLARSPKNSNIVSASDSSSSTRSAGSAVPANVPSRSLRKRVLRVTYYDQDRILSDSEDEFIPILQDTEKEMLSNEDEGTVENDDILADDPADENDPAGVGDPEIAALRYRLLKIKHMLPLVCTNRDILIRYGKRNIYIRADGYIGVQDLLNIRYRPDLSPRNKI